MITKDTTNGSFDGSSAEVKEFVMAIQGNYYYRDGFHKETGCWGTMNITPEEFRDCLAYVVMAVKTPIIEQINTIMSKLDAKEKEMQHLYYKTGTKKKKPLMEVK